MEKRVTFKGWLLPLLLIAPQLLISAVFFFYPAAQAIWQSLFIPDPFGLSAKFVGLGNFEYLLSDKFYRASFITTAVFSILVTLFIYVWMLLFVADLMDIYLATKNKSLQIMCWSKEESEVREA